MAIPFVTIELDKPRRLRFGMGAICEFKDLTGIDIRTIKSQMNLETCMKILWVMLRQDDQALEYKAACKLVDDFAPSLQYVVEKIAQIMKASFPEAAEDDEKN
jgi:hypothetical protein